MLTVLGTQAARQLRQRLPLARPAGTVNWHTPWQVPAIAACRRDRPPSQRPWYAPPRPGRISRTGCVLTLNVTTPVLKSWAAAVAELGDWLRDGMDYPHLNGVDGGVQVITDYRQRVSAARTAHREIFAGPASTLPPAAQQPLIWQRGAAMLPQERPAYSP